MFIGFMFGGMVIGALTGCYFVFSGGSILLGVALYVVVGALVVILAALASFMASEARAAREVRMGSGPDQEPLDALAAAE